MTTMTYSEAKEAADAYMACSRNESAILKAFPGVGSGPMGLTPDYIKNMDGYKVRKARADKAFQQLRTFNAWYVKHFAKEIREERRARQPA